MRHAKCAAASAAVLLALGAAPAEGQTCGSAITQSTVLRANIGPCPGTALTVPDWVRNITLDLNGFTITGTNKPGSAGIHVQGAMIFVTGPGTIANFESGVLIQRYAPQKSTVEGLRLRGNRWGINMLSTPSVMAGENRILRNRIEGPGEVGIRNDASLFMLAAWNTITGQSAAGIGVYNGHHAIVEWNSSQGNGVGIYFNGWCEPSLARHNDASNNRFDGISGVSHQLTIEDNVAMRNGRDGIAVAGFWPGATELNTLIESNRVLWNGRRGIAVGNVDASPAEDAAHNTGGGTVRVVGNFARQNGSVDLFWSGGGPNNCWSQNNAGGSSPATLPACQ